MHEVSRRAELFKLFLPEAIQLIQLSSDWAKVSLQSEPCGLEIALIRLCAIGAIRQDFSIRAVTRTIDQRICIEENHAHF